MTDREARIRADNARTHGIYDELAMAEDIGYLLNKLEAVRTALNNGPADERPDYGAIAEALGD